MSKQLLDAVPLTTLSGVGAAISDKLSRLGIHNLQDLLFHLPIRYEDRTRITPIADLRPEQYATIEGVVQTCEVAFGRRPILTVSLSDGTSKVMLRFFNFNAGMKNSFQIGTRVKAFGEIKRGLLGIKGMELTADIAKAFKLDVQRGAFISEVLPGSGSAKAGVKSGDVITSLNGKPLSSFAELRSRIATTEPGTKVKLGLLRDGKPLEVEVTLDTSTSSSASAEMIAPALQGATLSDGQLKDGNKGIKIDNVEKSSPAAQAGLHKDDVIISVNRDRVHSIAEMRKVLEAKPSIIALQVVRGNENIYLLLR